MAKCMICKGHGVIFNPKGTLVNCSNCKGTGETK